MKLYRYNSAGVRIDAEATLTLKRGQDFMARVPKGGLVIAER